MQNTLVCHFCKHALLLSLVFMATLGHAQASASYREAAELIRTGRLDEGIAILRPLVERYPDLPKLHNLLGIALTAQGKTKEANAEFRRALKSDPRFVPALKN